MIAGRELSVTSKSSDFNAKTSWFKDDKSVSSQDTDVETGLAKQKQDRLNRGLSRIQIQMIAIGGTIGTGLFLGTGKSLAKGGPASVLICYAICGFIVWQTMLCLSEMSAHVPIAGSFTTYTSRFVDESLGFGLTWNYWFNDAVSVAGDLTASMMLLEYWADFPSWTVALALLIFLIIANTFGVRVYGYIEYTLSILKVATIIVFILLCIIVNAGGNKQHEYIGFKNWRIEGAPFVGGIGGFASVFVTAAFAYGGTESIGVTSGETKNPTKVIPSVITNVFWRILLFYILGNFMIGLNVPYNAEGLSEGDVMNSPFVLVFKLAGFDAAAHLMNTIILTSVISAGNHALFAGSRLMYALGVEGHAPKFVTKLNSRQVPLFAVGLTSLISCICFASSFVGHGTLWTWIQALVGVSNQLAWVCIGLTSWRFRRAMILQGKKFNFVNPCGSWGPLFVFFSSIFLVLVQGWSSLVPSQSDDGRFHVMDFLSYYIEIPLLLIMALIWKICKKTKLVSLEEMDLDIDHYEEEEDDDDAQQDKPPLWKRFVQVVL